MILTGVFLAAVVVGALAQLWKGRTGALWWFLTMVVQGAILLVGFVVTADNPRFNLYPQDVQDLTHLTMSLFGAAGMALLVATLPNRTARQS